MNRPCRSLSVMPPLRWMVLLVAVSGLALIQDTAYAAKRPLRHSDYDSWRDLSSPRLSPDGAYVAYILFPQVGDGEFVVRNLGTGKEWRHGRGLGLATSSSLIRSARHRFAPDSRTVIFTIYPTRAALAKARKAKKKLYSAMGIMNLATGKVTRIERVRSYQVPEEGPPILVYHRYAEPSKATGEKKVAGRKSSKPAKPTTRSKTTVGTDLVIRDLRDQRETVLGEVSSYSLSKDGRSLVYTVSSNSSRTNGVYVLQPSYKSSLVLLQGPGRYTRLNWDEDQTQLAFLRVQSPTPAKNTKKPKATAAKKGASSRPTSKASRTRVTLHHWTRQPKPAVAGEAPQLKPIALGGTPVPGTGTVGGVVPVLSHLYPLAEPQARELKLPKPPAIQKGWEISDRGSLSFSRDGSKLFFGLVPGPKPRTKKSQVNVEIWHWQHGHIQPMRKVREKRERLRTFRAVYHLSDGVCRQLEDEKRDSVNPAPAGDWALGTDDAPHRRLTGYGPTLRDYYLVNMRHGKRRSVIKKLEGSMRWSTSGRYLLFFDDNNWKSIAVSDGKIHNLTGKLKISFGQEDNDRPMPAYPYGVTGWTKDDAQVLLNDRYDIWLASPDGRSLRNLTSGVGRKTKTRFRYLRLNSKERFIDPSKPMLLRAENVETRATGFYQLEPGKEPVKLRMEDRYLSSPVKARNADVLLLTASTFHTYPDLHITDSTFAELKKVSDNNAQKNKFLWGRTELVRYKNLDGVSLQGVLIKPENFNPNKKYPLMVYIYEKLSSRMHRFVRPRPGTSINASYYASNGYLVLMPDIVYTVGYPGASAVKCVLPAIQAVVNQGIVDEQAIGIQGHSWGGYQVAYLITKTTRFKAASAGAPVSNMTSAYGGIRWSSGLPRQFQYERTQSRIGGSLWQYPVRYIENSPLFHANRVQTPVMMLHNDKDGAVPWYQGIEYYLALRRLKKEAYLFNYPGEGHGLRKRANQKDYTVRMQQFFDHYLKDGPRPKWMTADGK